MSDITPYLFSIASSFAFILVFVICGLVRWFHMCRPYDCKADYYYPARKIVAVSYLAACVQLPYLFNWSSPDAWLLVRGFFIVYVPAISSLAFKKFFFKNEEHDKYSYALIVGLSVSVILMMFVMACFGGDLSGKHSLIKVAIIAVSLLLTVYLLYVTIRLSRQIGDFVRGEYSNDEDFPVRFATSIVFVPTLATAIAWGAYVCDSRTMTSVMNVIMTVTGFTILLVILHPQRNGGGSPSTDVINIIESSASEIENTPVDDNSDALPESRLNGTLPEYLKDRLEQQIRSLVSEKRLFLHPGLKRSELSEMLGSNRTYLSIVFKERFGSFYGYINRLRIEYAIRYAEEHPGADRQEIAVNSGFGSVKTYDRVRKAYMAGDFLTAEDK